MVVRSHGLQACLTPATLVARQLKARSYVRRKKRLSKMLSESVNDMSEEKAAEFRLRQSVVDVFLSRQQPA